MIARPNMRAAVPRKASSRRLVWLLLHDPTALTPPEQSVFHTFAEGLKQDEQAIVAALTVPWSNGPLEGFVNKIKTIKRQMYGRGSCAMLRQRVLLAA